MDFPKILLIGLLGFMVVTLLRFFIKVTKNHKQFIDNLEEESIQVPSISKKKHFYGK